MQELEKILEEINLLDIIYDVDNGGCLLRQEDVEEIIRKYMENDGWIPVEQKPNKDYIAVLAVDKHDYYFVAVYDKEHGFRSNDIGADVDNIVAYSLFNPYRTERSDNHDGE